MQLREALRDHIVMTAPPDAHQKSSYSVKSIEAIAEGTDVRVRLFSLAPSEIIPWHYHSQCTDHYFVLGGKLTVETRNPPMQQVVKIGARHWLQPGVAHQISNRSKEECRFLLVQGVGAFDWVKAD